MFSKLSLLSLVLPLVSALVLEIPERPTSGGQVTIHWTNQQGDPATFSLELVNEAFNNAFALANNVDPASSELTFTLPIVPVGAGYTLEAVNIGNITDVYATTGTFSIGDTTTTISSASSTTSGTSSTTGTVTRANSTTLTGASSTTSGFTSVISSASTSSTATTPSATDTTATTTPTSANFNAGVSLSGNAGGLTAVLLSLGAVMLSL